MGEAKQALARALKVCATMQKALGRIPDEALQQEMDACCEQVKQALEELYDAPATLFWQTGAQTLYRQLVDNVADVLFAVDTTGTIIFVNQAVTHVLGYAVHELIGEPFLSLSHPEDRPEIKRRFESALTGNCESNRFRIIIRSGEERLVHVAIRPFRREGQLAGLVGVLTDVTQQTEAEWALRESEEQYRTLVENINDVIYTLSSEGIILYISPVIEQVLGYSPQELIGQSFAPFVHPEDRERIVARLEPILAGLREPVEFRLLHRQGYPVYVRTSSRAIRLGNGQMAITGALSDITIRRHAETALQHSQALLRQFLNASPGFIFMKDNEGRFMLVNQALAEAYGTTVETMEGRTEQELAELLNLDLDEIAAFTRSDNQVLMEGVPEVVVEHPFTSRGKQPRWFRTIKRGVILPDGTRGLLGTSIEITDLKRAEAALRENESFLRRVINASPGCMFLKDHQGRFVLVNRTLAQAYGTTVQQMLGRTEEELAEMLGLHQEEIARFVETDRQLLEGEATEVVYEHQFTNPEGKISWYQTVKIAIERDGRRNILGTSLDISSRVKAQKALQRSRAFLREVIDAIPGSVFMKDSQQRFVLVNRTMAAFHDTMPEIFQGFTNRQLAPILGLSSKELEVFEETDNAILEQGKEQIVYEVAVEKGDPKRVTHWFRTIKRAVVDEHGERSLLGIAIDITDRRQAELALRRSEERYRLLVENAPLGVLSLDEKGRIQSANRRMLEILDAPSEEALIGRTFQSLGLAPVLVQDMNACLEKGQHMVGEILNWQSPWGRETSLRYHLAPINDDYGKCKGIQAIVEDISEHRRLEAGLRQAAKMEAIGQLAGGVAHSFNNLLTVINGYTEIALEDLPLAHPVRRDLEMVLQAGRRAADLAKRLLTFSRRQRLEPRIFDLNALVASMGTMLRQTIGEDIKLRISFGEEPSLVNCDEGQVEQMLFNMVANSRDAMPAGGALTIEVRNVELEEDFDSAYLPFTPGPYVLLGVHDTGIGMDQETLSHLFEPFFTTKEVGKGTGLGLATMYGVLRDSGGTVQVVSTPGQGTSFLVFLPRVTMDIDRSDQIGDEHEAVGGNETILVVEDQEDVRSYLATLLGGLGYRVLTASGANEALGICLREETPIDLVLVDVVMPEISGPQFVAQLMGAAADSKVLYMSGYTRHELAAKAGPLADYPLIEKPFTRASLAQRIRQVLDGREVESDGAQKQET